MTIQIQTEKTYTIAEYEALPAAYDDYELVEGRLVQRMAGSNEEHARISSKLLTFLGYYVYQNQLGEVYNSDARYTTIPGDPPTVRQADASFMSRTRVVKKVYTIPHAPDLTVEVLSESNSYLEIEQKIREYLSAGTRLVWIIEPDPQLVYIYRAGSNLRTTLTKDDELDGEDVIPGFKLKISVLFE